jgi:hypothetical protein
MNITVNIGLKANPKHPFPLIFRKFSGPIYLTYIYHDDNNNI